MSSQSTHALFGYFEDLADAHELDLILQQPPEQVRAELLADGADLERVRMALLHAMGEGEAPPARAPRSASPPPPAPPAKVIPIAKARPDRVVSILRTISVGIAASFFGLFVWKQGTMRVTPERPGRSELSDSRPVPPPSYMVETDLQKAARLRVAAHKLCDQGYWGECWDRLDEAGRLDRAGNQTLEVNEMRNRIARGMHEDDHGAVPTFAKPSVGPGEVPLRRHQH
jgi:hypothetical protein